MARILVIDDDPTIRQVIAFTLADEGHQVDEASDGQVALELVEQFRPDIILLDMKMPGVDGWEFVRRYRERYGKQPPIIVITAAKDAGRRGDEVDATSYLAKPFDLDALVEHVSSFTRTPDPNLPT